MPSTCSIPSGIVTSWNAGAQRFKGYEAARDRGRELRPLLRGSRPQGGAAGARPRDRRARGQVRGRGLARAQGRHPLLGPCRDRRHPRRPGRADRLRQDHARPHRAPQGRGGAAPQRRALPAAGRGRHRLRDLHARPHGRGQQLERRRPAHQGLPRRRDRRPALLALLHRGGSRPRRAGARARHRRARGTLRGRGWRVRKDGTPLLGQRRDRRHPRSVRATARLRQDHARHHRTPRSATGARADARGAAAVAEDRGDRQADRRRGARLQQPPDRGAGQPRPAAPLPAGRRSAHRAAARQRRAGRPARRHAHPAHAGLRAPPGPRPAGGRREPTSCAA